MRYYTFFYNNENIIESGTKKKKNIITCACMQSTENDQHDVYTIS